MSYVVRAIRTANEGSEGVVVEWSVLLPALLAIAGSGRAYLTARLSRAETYADWRRNHLYDLYVELVPTLRRIEATPESDWELPAEATRLGEALEEIRELIPARKSCARTTPEPVSNVSTNR